MLKLDPILDSNVPVSINNKQVFKCVSVFGETEINETNKSLLTEKFVLLSVEEYKNLLDTIAKLKIKD